MKISAALRSFWSDLPGGTVLLGVLAGFGGMCALGRLASTQSDFKHFERLIPWTSPETKYYPTVGEMMSLVRARMKPGQVLVIVGGNSVLRGAGQPPGRIWTQSLQQDLGPGYCVVNLAFDGSGITDAAAVVAEALRHEYPRQIYLANAAPTQPPAPDGTGVYRFVYWEAYYKGLLIDDPVRAAAVVESNRNPDIANPVGGTGLRELRLREWLDHWFYFQDLWNRFTYLECNTVWGFYMPGTVEFLQARRYYRDLEPDRTTFPLSIRYPEAGLAAEMINVRGCSEFAYMSFSAAGRPQTQKDSAGHWPLYVPVWDQFQAGIRVAMPEELKKRTLILLSRSSPFYFRLLTPDEQERDDLTYRHSAEQWKAGGYEAMDYGRDFTIDDYGDRTHLTSPGGVKLALLVAPKVQAMAQSLGYLSP